MNIHLSDDQLVDRLYGISAEGGAHLDSCAECQARWNRIEQRREVAAAPAAPPAEFFRQQRRQIQSRLAMPAPMLRMMWVPAAFAALLIAGIIVSRPAPKPPTLALKMDTGAIVDAGWYEDTYSATHMLEPRAASPIRELFEKGPVLE